MNEKNMKIEKKKSLFGENEQTYYDESNTLQLETEST